MELPSPRWLTRTCYLSQELVLEITTDLAQNSLKFVVVWVVWLAGVVFGAIPHETYHASGVDAGAGAASLAGFLKDGNIRIIFVEYSHVCVHAVVVL